MSNAELDKVFSTDLICFKAIGAAMYFFQQANRNGQEAVAAMYKRYIVGLLKRVDLDISDLKLGF